MPRRKRSRICECPTDDQFDVLFLLVDGWSWDRHLRQLVKGVIRYVPPGGPGSFRYRELVFVPVKGSFAGLVARGMCDRYGQVTSHGYWLIRCIEQSGMEKPECQ